jgi:hypothetical protein
MRQAQHYNLAGFGDFDVVRGMVLGRLAEDAVFREIDAERLEVRSVEDALAEVWRILDEEPPLGLDANLEALPITPELFTTKPGFWDEYAKIGRRE